MNSRHLTVSYRQPDSRCRVLVHRLEPMPFVRLQGRWLDQADFTIGAQVRVQVTPGRLVLEVDTTGSVVTIGIAISADIAAVVVKDKFGTPPCSHAEGWCAADADRDSELLDHIRPLRLP